jgi:dihydrofolate reductase
MRKVIFEMGVSLDGYIAGPDGDFGWAAPSPELHQLANDHTKALGAHLLGRRLYETMVYWETAHEDPGLGPIEREFAAVWQALPKVVFSRRLSSVEGDTRLARGTLGEEIARLQAEPGGDIGIGGAGLAAAAAREDLIDEYGMWINPVLAGGGTPFFPPLDARQDLELVETRTFGDRVVYVRYRRAR